MPRKSLRKLFAQLLQLFHARAFPPGGPVWPAKGVQTLPPRQPREPCPLGRREGPGGRGFHAEFFLLNSPGFGQHFPLSLKPQLFLLALGSHAGRGEPSTCILRELFIYPWPGSLVSPAAGEPPGRVFETGACPGPGRLGGKGETEGLAAGGPSLRPVSTAHPAGPGPGRGRRFLRRGWKRRPAAHRAPPG